jgi:hypothetical protein
MTEYFYLQFRMTNRKLIALGLHPFIGYLLGFAGFVLISEYLFVKTDFARYLLVLAALGLLLGVAEKNRIEFLKIVFGDKKSRQIRILENVLLVSPFVILLLIHSAYWETIVLLILSPVLALNTYNTSFNFTLPTPFYRKPFEFIVGFRKTFFLFPLVYLLAFIAVSVDNFNLGIFSLMIIYLVSITFYPNPEKEYYVWIFSMKPQMFLFEKLKTATFFTGFLVLPILISLIAFYPEKTDVTLMFILLGFAFLWTIILAKYSAYPNEMNIPEGVLIAICLYFPPLLLALMPFFYFKSVKKLNAILI